jgi:ABC-type polysaccharide/polyol phosphate transport system ATPase subunit
MTASGSPAVEVRDLGIQYNLRLSRRATLRQSVVGMLRRRDRTTATSFWAVRNLSFDVRHGDTVAIVGPNGAGKTTLLLALAGILAPSEGEVRLYGQTSTLLTIGAGFDGELTGLDNIDLAGAFLGLSQKQMTELVPEIIEFADIGAFIDAPLKTYSTGMRARLGFAIATAITPDILLLDEVLGTGDQDFREKSQSRIRELVRSARAVIVVTHDLGYVTEYCNRAILLERGTVVHDGDPSETVKLYHQRVEEHRLLVESRTPRLDS